MKGKKYLKIAFRRFFRFVILTFWNKNATLIKKCMEERVFVKWTTIDQKIGSTLSSLATIKSSLNVEQSRAEFVSERRSCISSFQYWRVGFDAANAVAAFAASCPLDKNISDKSEREAPM